MSQALNYGLFVGTNYAGTNNELYGCINDATDLQKLFQSQCQETKTLLGKEASRKNILDELKRILGLMTRQDTLIFSYSGHGTWVADTSGDEPDGKDEAICPDDFPDTGILLDDDIDKALSARKAGSKIVMLTDSCFSGSVFRFVGPLTGGKGKRIKFIPPAEILTGSSAKKTEALADRIALSTAKSSKKTNAPKSGLIHFSGCSDTEYSYDAEYDKPNGAFTYNFIQAYNNLKKGGTWLDLWQEIRKLLPSRDYPQSPKLNATTSNRRMKVIGK